MTVEKIIEKLELLKKENDTHTIYESMHETRKTLENKGMIPRPGTYNPSERNGIIYFLGYIQTACGNAVREFKRNNSIGYAEDINDVKEHLKSLITEIRLAGIKAKPSND